MVDLGYIARRLTFSFELGGRLAQLKYFGQELISLSTRIRPPGIQKVTWLGPKGPLILNFYDSLACFRSEILDGHYYDVEFENKNPIILDIGSNQGFSVAWFKYNHPEAIVYAYEPVQKSFDVLVKNVTDNKFQNCILKNFGVLDNDETATIYHAPGGAGLGDTLCADNIKGWDEEEIRLVNLDPEFAHVDKIDLIKLDAEGAEYPIIQNCNFWKKADQLIIEFHDNFKKAFDGEAVDFIKLVKDAGFKLDKTIGEGKVYICYFSKI